MGHGVRAALVTSMVRALMEQHSAEVSDPGELLSHVNVGLVSILKNTGMVVFVTSLVLIADMQTRRFCYANAGHPRPFHIRRKQGTTLSLNGPSGPALGVFEAAKYGSQSVEMTPGDLIILFTDGLFEVENPEAELFSQRDLHAAVEKWSGAPPAQLFKELLGEVRSFARREEFDDDVCIVGVEVAIPASESLGGENPVQNGAGANGDVEAGARKDN
jgi:serine phosphatase RsbU (regulator of sigma subunit)